MKLLVSVSFVVPGLLATVGLLAAANASIGFAVADGNFRIDSGAVSGNATLFEGTVIETGKAPSQLQLTNGAQVRLATESRAKVFRQRTVLEKGFAQLETSEAYPLEAGTLLVTATRPGSVARVRMGEQGRVLVAAVRGSVRVTTSVGLAVGNLADGASMEFDPQAGAAAASKVTGCLELREGNASLVDTTTHVLIRVAGDKSLEKEMGNVVELTGVQDPITHTLTVTGVRQVGKGCVVTAKNPRPVSGRTVAIIGGVAVAGVAGGLGVAGVFTGSDAPVASR